MISSIFERTNPLNFVILFLYLLFFLTAIQVGSSNFVFETESFVHLFKCAVVIFLSVILVDFIVRKNQLTQRNSYALFFFVFLFCLFPNISIELNLLIANFFLLLALRRLISIRSNRNVEIKVFDATLWILIASYFYNWTVVFVILVFSAMILYKKNDYRNMLIPFVALSVVVILGFTYFYWTNQLEHIKELVIFQPVFNVDKYTDVRYLFPLTFLCLMGIWACIMFAFKKQSKSFKTRVPGILLAMTLTLAIVVAFIAEVPNTSELLFALCPLAIIQAKYLERIRISWLKELILWAYISVPILVLFL